MLSLHHTENAQPKRLKRSQSRSAKQEQDLFLRFSIKKSLDSIEKAYIVPISESLSVLLVEFLALDWVFRRLA
ncbi:TolB protein [Vibrio cholerae]